MTELLNPTGWFGAVASVIMVCPVCEYDYSHHEKTQEFRRVSGEDGMTFIRIPGSNVQQPSLTNPSPQRGAVRLYFRGECEHRWHVDFIQHKGQTFVVTLPIENSQGDGIVSDMGAGVRQDITVYRQIDECSDGWECMQCGGTWSLMDGTPSDNEMQYCPYCGRKIVGEEPWEDYATDWRDWIDHVTAELEDALENPTERTSALARWADKHGRRLVEGLQFAAQAVEDISLAKTPWCTACDAGIMEEHYNGCSLAEAKEFLRSLDRG